MLPQIMDDLLVLIPSSSLYFHSHLVTITDNNHYTVATGTGKSYVLRVLQDVLESLGLSEKIAFTAPTGVAACNVRGLTIHSWSGIGRGDTMCVLSILSAV
jgi:PIF1-like helicase